MTQDEFLVSTFYSTGGPPRSDAFALLSRPCIIKIGYIEQDKIEAEIKSTAPRGDVLSADEWLLMFFVNGVWEIAE